MNQKRSDKTTTNIYARLIEDIFRSRFRAGRETVEFERADIEKTAKSMGIRLPKNLGDMIYSFRYRVELPQSIRQLVPPGRQWIIRPVGRSRYSFASVALSVVAPNAMLAETKLPDATPGIIDMYALSDEQALLAKLRYNRLVDIFTALTCQALQSHLRTTVSDIGQVETDEVYVGLEKRGAHYVLPVQAKSGRDRISIVQIEQDIAMCRAKFPTLLCFPIAAQFAGKGLIAMFLFEEQTADKAKSIRLVSEKHYRLVPPEDLKPEEIVGYRNRAAEV